MAYHMIGKQNHAEKLHTIKINTSKEEWIEAFEKRVEKYEEGKDYLHETYAMPKLKFNLDLYMGEYKEESDEIIFVYILPTWIF